jgi:hypothetical protein
MNTYGLNEQAVLGNTVLGASIGGPFSEIIQSAGSDSKVIFLKVNYNIQDGATAPTLSSLLTASPTVPAPMANIIAKLVIQDNANKDILVLNNFGAYIATVVNMLSSINAIGEVANILNNAAIATPAFAASTNYSGSFVIPLELPIKNARYPLKISFTLNGLNQLFTANAPSMSVSISVIPVSAVNGVVSRELTVTAYTFAAAINAGVDQIGKDLSNASNVIALAAQFTSLANVSTIQVKAALVNGGVYNIPTVSEPTLSVLQYNKISLPATYEAFVLDFSGEKAIISKNSTIFTVTMNASDTPTIYVVSVR